MGTYTLNLVLSSAHRLGDHDEAEALPGVHTGKGLGQVSHRPCLTTGPHPPLQAGGGSGAPEALQSRRRAERSDTVLRAFHASVSSAITTAL